MAGEPHNDGWLPLDSLERLEIEVRAQWALYQELRADLDDLKARVAALEAHRATRDEDNR